MSLDISRKIAAGFALSFSLGLGFPVLASAATVPTPVATSSPSAQNGQCAFLNSQRQGVQQSEIALNNAYAAEFQRMQAMVQILTGLNSLDTSGVAAATNINSAIQSLPNTAPQVPGESQNYLLGRLLQAENTNTSAIFQSNVAFRQVVNQEVQVQQTYVAVNANFTHILTTLNAEYQQTCH